MVLKFIVRYLVIKMPTSAITSYKGCQLFTPIMKDARTPHKKKIESMRQDSHSSVAPFTYRKMCPQYPAASKNLVSLWTFIKHIFTVYCVVLIVIFSLVFHKRPIYTSPQTNLFGTSSHPDMISPRAKRRFKVRFKEAMHWDLCYKEEKSNYASYIRVEPNKGSMLQ